MTKPPSFFTDPCKDNDNSLNVMCRVEALTRQTLIFAPPESCPPANEPLCASDGQTYTSECAMSRTGMQKGVKLRKIHAGPCKKLGKGISSLGTDIETLCRGICCGQNILAWITLKATKNMLLLFCTPASLMFNFISHLSHILWAVFLEMSSSLRLK